MSSIFSAFSIVLVILLVKFEAMAVFSEDNVIGGHCVAVVELHTFANREGDLVARLVELIVGAEGGTREPSGSSRIRLSKI